MSKCEVGISCKWLAYSEYSVRDNTHHCWKNFQELLQWLQWTFQFSWHSFQMTSLSVDIPLRSVKENPYSHWNIEVVLKSYFSSGVCCPLVSGWKKGLMKWPGSRIHKWRFFLNCYLVATIFTYWRGNEVKFRQNFGWFFILTMYFAKKPLFSAFWQKK